MPEIKKSRALITVGFNSNAVLATDDESLNWDAENMDDINDWLHDLSGLFRGVYLWEGTGSLSVHHGFEGDKDVEMEWDGEVRKIQGEELEELLYMTPPERGERSSGPDLYDR